jgi:hypothetical protein
LIEILQYAIITASVAYGAPADEGVSLNLSVIKCFSFHRFLNPENLKKPEKTRKPLNLGTYVPQWGNSFRKFPFQVSTGFQKLFFHFADEACCQWCDIPQNSSSTAMN